MADSLRLKGCKSISKHTGDEMLLRRPKRGGDIFKVPTWWNLKHTTQYVSAAIFKVTASVGELALVVPVDPETTDIIIKHDGNGNFTFPSVNGVDRIAVMAADLGTFYVEYQFSKISGGPVLKRTVNALPTVDPVVWTSQTTLSGESVVGGDATITAATYTGGSNVTSYQVQLQRSANGTDGWSGFSSWATSPDTVTLGANVEGQYVRGVTRVIDDSGTKTRLSANVVGPIGPAVVTTADINNATFSYVVTVVDDNGDDVYALDGVNQAGIAGSTGDSFYFDLSDASMTGGAGNNHPFKIYTDSTKTTEVTVGITQSGTDLLFVPPIAGTFSYQCANHADMGGTITVS